MAATQQSKKEFVRTKIDLAYVIQATGDQRIVKVGRSADPIGRFKGIRCSVPFEIRLIAILTDGARREREMKSLLADSRVKGEWFAPDKRLNEYLSDAAKSKAVVEKKNTDEGFFKHFILPLILEYLNGRTPTYTEGGDFVYRIVHAGFGAANNRLQRLLGTCPKTFTPELLAGYVPLEFDVVEPSIFISESTVTVSSVAPLPEESA